MPTPNDQSGRVLLVVRHAQSEWNAARRWQGVADSPLTELGRRQARTAAEVVADRYGAAAFEGIWSSDLGRAVQTASILAEVLGSGPIRTDVRLREAAAGPWEGLGRAEIVSGWPGHLEGDLRPAGFEPRESVTARSVEVVTALLDRPLEESRRGSTAAATLVVTHSGVLRALRHHLGAPDERVPNLGGLWLRSGPDGLELTPLDTVVDEITAAPPGNR